MLNEISVTGIDSHLVKESILTKEKMIGANANYGRNALCFRMFLYM